jgi:hypothetical protein
VLGKRKKSPAGRGQAGLRLCVMSNGVRGSMFGRSYLLIACSGEFHLAFVEQRMVFFGQMSAGGNKLATDAMPLLPALAHNLAR